MLTDYYSEFCILLLVELFYLTSYFYSQILNVRKYEKSNIQNPVFR